MTITERDLGKYDQSPAARVENAVAFARHWKTWPVGCSDVVEFHAFRAAAEHLRRHPDATKFDIAKAAANAARREVLKRR